MRARRILGNERGDATYLSAVVFFAVSLITLFLMLSALSVVMTKQKLDLAADSLTRQIQLSGEVGEDTELLWDHLRAGLSEDASYTVETVFLREGKIQLGTPFTLELTATVPLGGGIFSLFPVSFTSRAGGVSERYWKEELP